MSRTNLPSYRLHKPTGQAIVSLRGKIFYLGKYKSKASREKYTELIAQYTSNGSQLPPTRKKTDAIIETLCYDYLDDRKAYFTGPNAKPNDTFAHCKLAIAPVIEHYGMNAISDFGPRSLIFIQKKWEKKKIARETINLTREQKVWVQHGFFRP